MNRPIIRIFVYFAIVSAIIAFGTISFVVFEQQTVLDSIYYSIVTISTVGFGDIHPTTVPGKIATIALIIMGVGAFLGFIANFTEILIHRREGSIRKQKVNILIGLFFSEIGLDIIALFNDSGKNVKAIDAFCHLNSCGEREFRQYRKLVKNYDYSLEYDQIDFPRISSVLKEKKDLLVRLLENPVLLEHTNFTELLRSIFHLYEEMNFRMLDSEISTEDKQHMAIDSQRIYQRVIPEWFKYMRYLKRNYPYLFVHTFKINPFLRSPKKVNNLKS